MVAAAVKSKIGPILQRAVLSQVLRRKLPDEDVTPGEYRLRGEVRIDVDCTVTKGEDTDARATPHPDWAAVLGIALQRAGVQLGLIPIAVEQAIALSTVSDLPIAASQVYIDMARAGVDRAVEKLANEMPRRSVSGATKVAGQVKITRFDPR